MNALIMNCSPVRYGATAEVCGIIVRQLSEHFAVRSVCIDDYHFAFCKKVQKLPYDSHMCHA